MSSVEGYFDGECVRLLEKGNFKKNQRVVVTLAEGEEEVKEEAPAEDDRDLFMEALLTNSLVIKTDLNVDEYIRELRSHDRV